MQTFTSENAYADAALIRIMFFFVVKFVCLFFCCCVFCLFVFCCCFFFGGGGGGGVVHVPLLLWSDLSSKVMLSRASNLSVQCL